MLVKKKAHFLILIIATSLIISQSALALLSSGTADYDVGDLHGYIAYAVYESRTEYETVWEGLGFSAPGDGQYVYIYQIRNDLLSNDVAYFALHDLINDNTSGLSAEDIEDGGIEPSDIFLDGDESKGVWEWSDGAGGYGYIQADESSWLLVYSSDYLPVVGEGEIRGPDLGMENTNDTISILVPDVPEPATLLLLALGTAALRKSK